jgi:hypothetical protein
MVVENRFTPAPEAVPYVMSRRVQWRCWLLGPRTHAEDVAMVTLGITPVLVQWMLYWHGRGEAHQQDYYRCRGCRKLVTWRHIRTGGCACGTSNQVSPALLTRWEKVRLILFPTLGLARRWRVEPSKTATLYQGEER